MYKLIYEPKSYFQLDNFINSYKEVFKKIYFDTWIYTENLIINTYIEAWEKLREEISNLIQSKISSDIVLWKKISENEQYSIVISLWNYRLFIDYSENIQEKIRYIENIEIYKK